MSEILPGIRAKRKALGLTMDQLADRLGVSRQAVSAWEGGIALPSADKLPEIAEALVCTVDELFREDPGPQPGPQKEHTPGRFHVIRMFPGSKSGSQDDYTQEEGLRP